MRISTSLLNSIAVLLLLPLSVFPSSAAGQEGARDPLLRGEVLVGGEAATQGMVILHRVTAEESGAIDSVRLNRDGRFQLRLPYVPDHTARPEIFFASYLHGGLAYFGPAITEASQLDSLYLIQAYDTVSVPPGGVELPVAVRNLFLERTNEGWAVTDLFQLFQEEDRTLYSPQEGVIWSYPLPPSAREFQVGQADLAPDALRFREGRMEVYAPLQPGERFLLVRYQLPVREFELPLPGLTQRLEIMVREPAPPAEFPPLEPTTPVELEAGNVYRRYAGEGLRDAVIQAQVAPAPWSFRAEWLGLILMAVLAGAAVWGYRARAGRGVPVTEGTGGLSREALLLAVARLDQEFAQQPRPTPEEKKLHLAQREELLRQIRRAN